MIPLDTMIPFCAAVFALSLAPGPDNVFVLTQSALHGVRAGVMVTLGLCVGLMIHTMAVSLGFAALVQASAVAFTAIKIAGAGYLLWLAYQAFTAPAEPLAMRGSALSGAALFRRGVVMNVTNPKVAIFFIAFFPQFADPARGSMAAQIAILGAAFIGIAFLSFSAIAYVAGSLSARLTRSASAQLWLNRVAGTVFVALAARLAFSER